MRKADEQKGRYMEVWGDTVVPGQLAASALICVITTMAFSWLAERSCWVWIRWNRLWQKAMRFWSVFWARFWALRSVPRNFHPSGKSW